MNRIEILDYKTEHQPYFEKFNTAWIEKYFWLEEIDKYVLQHPQEAILADGGSILMAVYDNIIAGTVALKKINDDVYEFTKMAVDEGYRGKGIGEALSNAAFEKAKKAAAKKIILYSHTGLVPAITMYKKLGFLEVPIELGVYKRSDIKMEIDLADMLLPQMQKELPG